MTKLASWQVWPQRVVMKQVTNYTVLNMHTDDNRMSIHMGKRAHLDIHTHRNEAVGDEGNNSYFHFSASMDLGSQCFWASILLQAFGEILKLLPHLWNPESWIQSRPQNIPDEDKGHLDWVALGAGQNKNVEWIYDLRRVSVTCGLSGYQWRSDGFQQSHSLKFVKFTIEITNNAFQKQK